MQKEMPGKTLLTLMHVSGHSRWKSQPYFYQLFTEIHMLLFIHIFIDLLENYEFWSVRTE